MVHLMINKFIYYIIIFPYIRFKMNSPPSYRVEPIDTASDFDPQISSKFNSITINR